MDLSFINTYVCLHVGVTCRLEWFINPKFIALHSCFNSLFTSCTASSLNLSFFGINDRQTDYQVNQYDDNNCFRFFLDLFCCKMMLSWPPQAVSLMSPTDKLVNDTGISFHNSFASENFSSVLESNGVTIIGIDLVKSHKGVR